jgi:type II secretory pathway pseudopilin PulG
MTTIVEPLSHKFQHEKTNLQNNTGREGGWTFVEVMIALVVLTVGVVSFLVSLTSSMQLSAAGHERDLATNAARQVIERMRTETFARIFSLYNEDANDDPGGVGTAPGADFDVAGLKAAPSDGDGKPGKIVFPVSGTELREDISDSLLGMPRDLNADTIVDSADHAGDYLVLPVVVRVEWVGIAGTETLEIRTLLTER